MGRFFRAGFGPLLVLCVFILAGCSIPGPDPTPTPTLGNSGDSFESDDSTNTAKAIANGATQNRTLHTATDVDWVKFTVDDTNTFYNFTVTASSVILKMDIYSVDTLLIPISTGDTNGVFENEITTLGTYYLKVTSFNGQKGSYTLHFAKDPLTISIRKKLGLLK